MTPLASIRGDSHACSLLQGVGGVNAPAAIPSRRAAECWLPALNLLYVGDTVFRWGDEWVVTQGNVFRYGVRNHPGLSDSLAGS
jgi:hypothetical protein